MELSGKFYYRVVDDMKQGHVEVYVDSHGIEKIAFSQLLEIGESNEIANTMPYEQINEIFEAQIKSETNRNSIETLYKIKYAYQLEKYDDGMYLVPTWMYYVRNENEASSFLFSDQAVFSINALDGIFSVLPDYY